MKKIKSMAREVFDEMLVVFLILLILGLFGFCINEVLNNAMYGPCVC